MLVSPNLRSIAVKLLFLAYSIFFVGFFFYTNKPDHYEYYYWAVLPFSILLAPSAFRVLRTSRLFWLVMAYAGYTLVAGLWSEPLMLDDFLFLGRRILYVLSFVIVTAVLLDEHPRAFDKLLKVTAICGAITAVVGVVLWYRVHPFPETRLLTVGKFEAPIESACAFGFYGLLAFRFALREHRPAIRLLFGICVAVIAAYVVLTQSRIGITAFAVATLMLAASRQNRLVFWLCGAFLAVAATTWILAPDLWGLLLRGVPYRPGIWEAVLEHVLDAPVFGHGSLTDRTVVVGPNTFVHAHSPFLAAFRDGGVVGLLLLTGMLGYAGVAAFRFRRGREDLYHLTLWVFLMLCIVANTDRFFVRPKEIWMYFWLPMVFIMWREIQARSRGLGAEGRESRRNDQARRSEILKITVAE